MPSFLPPIRKGDTPETKFGQLVEEILKYDIASPYPTGIDQSAEMAKLAALNSEAP